MQLQDWLVPNLLEDFSPTPTQYFEQDTKWDEPVEFKESEF